ncbi:MAG: hypothetical protein Q9216_002983 [Gyalolechia sp. 2 TL-2023]
MHSFKALFLAIPLLAQAATAQCPISLPKTPVRYVDFYEADCPGDTAPGMGTMTLTGEDGEEQFCVGGALPDPSGASGSVVLNGFEGSGLVVDLYSAQDCPADSFITSLVADGCFTAHGQVN